MATHTFIGPFLQSSTENDNKIKSYVMRCKIDDPDKDSIKFNKNDLVKNFLYKIGEFIGENWAIRRLDDDSIELLNLGENHNNEY